MSDLTYELADTVEHLSVWLDAGIDAARLLERFDLSAGDLARLTSTDGCSPSSGCSCCCPEIPQIVGTRQAPATGRHNGCLPCCDPMAVNPRRNERFRAACSCRHA